jgi:hypothetical protein
LESEWLLLAMVAIGWTTGAAVATTSPAPAAAAIAAVSREMSLARRPRARSDRGHRRMPSGEPTQAIVTAVPVV